MRTKIITFGKIKTKAILELVDYYSKLISKYSKVELINLKDVEGKIGIDEVEKYFECENTFKVVLSEYGKELTTPEFAEKLQSHKNQSQDLLFIIGNAFGVESELIKRADLALSLGKFTYPHELALVLLLEQLYRSGNLLAGGKYHK